MLRGALGAGVYTVLSPLNVLAAETVIYPSPDEVIPPEWSMGDCRFTTTGAEGPYYLDNVASGSDIRESQEDQDLRLNFEVFDTERCAPIPEAAVQIWHCNAFGLYGGYPHVNPDRLITPEEWSHMQPSATGRYLRGVQITDQKGKCEFLTKYPGWYAGRTVHIHLKIYLSNLMLLTSQLYFPQTLNDEVHDTKPYARHGRNPYRNKSDVDIAASYGAMGCWPTMTKKGTTHVATLKINVFNHGRG